MIILNKTNGDLQVDRYNFNAATTHSDIEALHNKYRIETYYTNNNSGFWQLHDVDGGDSTLQFLFSEGKLNWIQIGLSSKYNFPPFTITEEEKKIVKMRLAEMGGEKTYAWGSVSFSEDNKGGSVSIVIKYNKKDAAKK